jgi:hypothetical protein
MAQLARSPFQANRHTVEVSGNGTNNAGRNVNDARNEALAKGITINGLVILDKDPLPFDPDHTNPPGGLDTYYRNNVTGGPGSFVMPVPYLHPTVGGLDAFVNILIAEIPRSELQKSLSALTTQVSETRQLMLVGAIVFTILLMLVGAIVFTLLIYLVGASRRWR